MAGRIFRSHYRGRIELNQECGARKGFQARAFKQNRHQSRKAGPSFSSWSLQAAKPLATAFNVHPKYCAKLARKRGLRAVVKTRGIRTTFKDRRWQWAIERGAVIA